MKNLEKLTVAELRSLARENGLTGAVVLQTKKADLIKFIETGELPSAETKIETKTETKTETATTGDLGKMIADAIAPFITIASKPVVDHKLEEKVNKLEEKVNKIEKPLTIEIKNVEKNEIKNIGLQHELFPTILKLAQARIDMMLVGAAGSGKSHIAASIAEALGVDFRFLSVGLMTTKTDLLGYMDAVGNYISTPLREAYEHGGVFLMDEIDAGNAGILTIINAMLSNGVMEFPDKKINRHKDFIFIAAANTYGRGKDRMFVGRNQLDAATLDRFAVINFDYDEKLELALAGNKAFVKIVQGIRKNALKKGIKIVVSPRASIKGSQMLELGFKVDEVLEMLIFKGANDDTISQLTAGVNLTI